MSDKARGHGRRPGCLPLGTRCGRSMIDSGPAAFADRDDGGPTGASVVGAPAAARPAAGSRCRAGVTARTEVTAAPDTPRAQTRLKISVALVPPKPKLLDITASSFMLRFSRRIGRSATAGSRVSMLALAQAKSFCIIRIE